VTQVLKCLALDFGSGHEPRIVGSSPASGFGWACSLLNEHWVLYVSDESLNSTPETNTALLTT